jgi:radical SAM protein with 4Fe4S-binding SPASM domain
MLVLTGGDPLCREDIFELIEYATQSGLDVSVTPSATPLVTERAIRQFAEAGIHRMAISIDGSSAKTHDAVRGVHGSFDRSLEILSRARQLGIPTQINTTLTPENVDQLDNMAELFATLDITLWSVFFLVPVGRAETAGRLNAEETELAFAKLWKHSQHQPYMVKTTEAPHYRRFAIQHQHISSNEKVPNVGGGRLKPFVPTGVNDGKGIMFVSHTGTIHPSGFMPIVCGVFPLQHVVQVYQDSPIFRGLRDAKRIEGKCGQCEFRHICGGSRARAYAVTGNPFAQEPDCAYIPTSMTQ